MVHGSPALTGHIEAPLGLVQQGGGAKYRAFVEDTGKAGRYEGSCKQAAECWTFLQRDSQAASTRYERIWTAGEEGTGLN